MIVAAMDVRHEGQKLVPVLTMNAISATMRPVHGQMRIGVARQPSPLDVTACHQVKNHSIVGRCRGIIVRPKSTVATILNSVHRIRKIATVKMILNVHTLNPIAVSADLVKYTAAVLMQMGRQYVNNKQPRR